MPGIKTVFDSIAMVAQGITQTLSGGLVPMNLGGSDGAESLGAGQSAADSANTLMEREIARMTQADTDGDEESNDAEAVA